MTRTFRKDKLGTLYIEAVREAQRRSGQTLKAAEVALDWQEAARLLGDATFKDIKISIGARIGSMTKTGVEGDVRHILTIAQLMVAPDAPDKAERLKEALGKLAHGHISNAV